MFSGLHRAFNSEARLRNRSGDVHPSGARAGFPMAMAERACVKPIATRSLAVNRIPCVFLISDTSVVDTESMLMFPVCERAGGAKQTSASQAIPHSQDTDFYQLKQ